MFAFSRETFSLGSSDVIRWNLHRSSAGQQSSDELQSAAASYPRLTLFMDPVLECCFCRIHEQAWMYHLVLVQTAVTNWEFSKCILFRTFLGKRSETADSRTSLKITMNLLQLVFLPQDVAKSHSKNRVRRKSIKVSLSPETLYHWSAHVFILMILFRVLVPLPQQSVFYIFSLSYHLGTVCSHRSSSLSWIPCLTFLDPNDLGRHFLLLSHPLSLHMSLRVNFTLSPFSLFSSCSQPSTCIITFLFSVLFITPVSIDPGSDTEEYHFSSPLISIYVLPHC